MFLGNKVMDKNDMILNVIISPNKMKFKTILFSEKSFKHKFY